jgi:hypothetical protein
MPAGYSENLLHKKLGLKANYIVKLIHAPENYLELIGAAAPQIIIDNNCCEGLDFIHFFTNSIAEYETQLPVLRQQIKKEGTIWISWYKKSSGLKTELTENAIRDFALSAGLVDVKVCAVNEYWSSLKLVFRLKDR